MPDGLYERDFVLWSEAQADLLRRLAAGERVNAAVDWPNLIEEVEDLGRFELNTCRSLLLQALIHLAKLRAWPNSRAASHRRAETATFLANVRRQFAPSMRQRIDLDDIYDDPVRVARLEADASGEALALPDKFPFTLDQLLAKEFASTLSPREG